MTIRHIATLLLSLAAVVGSACEVADSVDTEQLNEVVVQTRRRATRKLSGATNTDLISGSELKRAACCNLGESFTTNPSVDVNYSDAVTGARQIRLLGLSGSYVQMLSENIPAFRGASAPFGLGYVPGTWLQSIQVSKGASSVKNGAESVTGQIDIEMLKPQMPKSLTANVYGDIMGKMEANVAGNVHLGKKWSTGILTHAENTFATHDGNGDGFIDMPDVRQLSVMNRWACFTDKNIFQAGVKFLDERRLGGQRGHALHHADVGHAPYTTTINTQRWEAFAKNAVIFDPDNDGNIAAILSFNHHNQDNAYGNKLYDVRHAEVYAALFFERKWGDTHALSAGVSHTYDNLSQDYRLTHDVSLAPAYLREREYVTGGYAQYTLTAGTRLTAMAGLRYDYSSLWGGFVTPRLHLRYKPLEALTLRASIGTGSRTPHVLADNSYLLASGRGWVMPDALHRESALNTGAGLSGYATVLGYTMNWSAEYYYTRFYHQTVADLDSNPGSVVIKDVGASSRSHSAQVEITQQAPFDLSFTAAFRYTDVRLDYGNGLVFKPLTSRWKGFFTASWAPDMAIWQLDATIAVNGPGRMPTPYTTNNGTLSWSSHYKAYPQLNAQITRNFRRWAVYVGGENLTGYRQKGAIIGASTPWSDSFDATMIYAPLHGAMAYAGFRLTLK